MWVAFSFASSVSSPCTAQSSSQESQQLPRTLLSSAAQSEARLCAFFNKDERDERAERSGWVSLACLVVDVGGCSHFAPPAKRITSSDTQNWTRWRVRPGASIYSRGLFRDGPKHRTKRKARVFIKARSQYFARSPPGQYRRLRLRHHQ